MDINKVFQEIRKRLYFKEYFIYAGKKEFSEKYNYEEEENFLKKCHINFIDTGNIIIPSYNNKYVFYVYKDGYLKNIPLCLKVKFDKNRIYTTYPFSFAYINIKFNKNEKENFLEKIIEKLLEIENKDKKYRKNIKNIKKEIKKTNFDMCISYYHLNIFYTLSDFDTNDENKLVYYYTINEIYDEGSQTKTEEIFSDNWELKLKVEDMILLKFNLSHYQEDRNIIHFYPSLYDVSVDTESDKFEKIVKDGFISFIEENIPTLYSIFHKYELELYDLFSFDDLLGFLNFEIKFSTFELL